MSEEAWLRLALTAEIGPVLGRRLLDVFGDPERIFTAAPRQLREIPGLGPARVDALLDRSQERLAREEWERVREHDVRLLTQADADYPPLLRQMEYPPLVLWVRGRIVPEDRLAVAVVGPRSPSAYARLMCERIAGPVAAQGLTVVSGMAYGIDGQAHQAALDAGGRTLAILGQGMGTPLYPQGHALLAERIVGEGRGALISIFSMPTEPSPGQFPQRNEIIAWISLGVVIVEASSNSGALITARHAAGAGRVVMACPGDATRRAAQGSNRLIADGAALVQSPDDVLEALGGDLRREMAELRVAAPEQASAAGEGGDSVKPMGNWARDPLNELLVEILGEEPCPVDAILERCAERGHAAPAILERLLTLELQGFLRQYPGRLYALKPEADRQGT